MRAGFARMFLNKGENENKRKGVQRQDIGHVCGEKKKKHMDENEMKEMKNNIKKKNSNQEILQKIL